MNMHSLGGSHLIKHECLDRYHVIVAMQAEKEVLLNAQGSTSISVVQFPAKKPKRQWVSITIYYRLVRRMNKLLGPGLSLHAKNPKDTNAAMDASGSLTSRVPTSVSFPSLEDNMNVDEYQLENGCVDPPATEGSHCLIRDVSFDSDSFDAAIPAHILRHQNKPPSALLQVPSGSSSIWDDEDTRDAFSFKKNRLAGSSKLANVAYPGGGLIINDLKYRGFICCGDSLGKEN
uniref:Uncharacterized protein n=1 Tax=Brassica oleracea TaxID=3712 RepID=A0A3P6D7A6_BRAOL|nr:unnamed protein product [Brassica oleracea]